MSDPADPARAYHHGNLRAALLERAWEAIEERGVDQLSLRQLARDVGVSHGASARHFSDRSALLDAVAVEGFARLSAGLAEAEKSPDGPGYAELFRSVAGAYVDFALAHPAMLDVMYAAKRLPGASQELLEAGTAVMSEIVRMIREAQAVGAVSPGDPGVLAVVAFAAVHGVATLATDDLLNGVSVHDAAAATIGFVWSGLASGVAA